MRLNSFFCRLDWGAVGVGKQNDHLNATLFKIKETKKLWLPWQKVSRSEITPKFLQCLHMLFCLFILFPNANLSHHEKPHIRTWGTNRT